MKPPTFDPPHITSAIRNGYVREGEEEEIVEPVIIYYPQPNDDWPYFKCPNCRGGFITSAFQRCIDCGARIIWKKLEIRTIGEMGVKNEGGGNNGQRCN